MNPGSGLLLAAAGIAAVLDWTAVARKYKPVEYAAKPAALAFLIAFAASIDPFNPWFVAALTFSLLGDVLLMLPRDLFLPGLASFLIAHLAYIAGLAGERQSTVTLLLAVVIMLFIGGALAAPILRSAPKALRLPIAAYAFAISTMAGCAVSTLELLAIAGAGLFFVSDFLIARQRFLRPVDWGPMAIIVTYHLGQAGLALSLLV